MPRAKRQTPQPAAVEPKPVETPTPEAPIAPVVEPVELLTAEPVVEPIEPPADPLPPVVDPDPEPEVIEPLAVFLSRIQESKLADQLVVVEASHPDANPGLYSGKYASFPMSQGPVSVRWNDGSTE